jgi:hypothetical protein
LVARGDRVSSGQVVGRLGGSTLEYSLEDSRGNKLNPKSFFGLSGEGDKPEDKDKDKEKEKKKKEEKYKKKSDGFELTPGLTIAHQVFADMLSAPLKVFKDVKMFTPGKLFKGKKTESISNQGKLIEEIQRIKSLLK